MRLHRIAVVFLLLVAVALQPLEGILRKGKGRLIRPVGNQRLRRPRPRIKPDLRRLHFNDTHLASEGVFKKMKGLNKVRTPHQALERAYIKLMKMGDSLRTTPNPPAGKDGLTMDFRLFNIIHMDDKNQMVKLKFMVNIGWLDPRLAWAHSHKLKAVERLSIFGRDLEQIWLPSLYFAQTADELLTFGESSVDIHSDGRVSMSRYVILTATCRMSVRKYSFDTQTCYVSARCANCDNFAAMHVKPEPRRPTFKRQADLSTGLNMASRNLGVKNSYFTLQKISIQLKQGRPVVTMVMKRNFSLDLFYFLLPAFVIVAATFCQFGLPVEEGEKVGLVVTCLLAMTVYLLLLQQNLAPDIEGNIPLLGLYFGLLMILILIILVMAMVVIKLHYRGTEPDAQPPSVCLLRCLLCAGKLIFVQRFNHILEQWLQHVQALEGKEGGGEGAYAPVSEKEDEAIEGTEQEQSKSKTFNIVDIWIIISDLVDRIFLIVAISLVVLVTVVTFVAVLG